MSARRDPEKKQVPAEVEPAVKAASEQQPGASPEAAGSTPQGSAVPAPTAQEGPSLADEKALREQLARLQAEKEELFKMLVRRQADFENYRKRTERERKEDSQRATALLVESVLPVLDAFEHALADQGSADNIPAYEEYRRGFELIYRQLWDALARAGLERIEAQGRPFDPYYHQAVERVESADHDDGTVIEELRSGYKFRGKVLRPAMVRVAAKPVCKVSETDRTGN